MSLADKMRESTHKRRERLIDLANRAIPYIQDEFKRTLNVPGSRTNRSRPGEPPRRQTGELVRSAYARYYIETTPDRWDLRIKFGANAPYFRYLQDGTPRMARRPSIEPTITRIRPYLTQLLIQSRGG